MNALAVGAYLFLPMFFGLTFHGLCIRFGWLRALARPIDRGATFRGLRLFGENKTWRGLTAVGTGTGCGYFLLAMSRWHPLPDFPPLGAGAFLFGLAVGIAAMLGELPNSFAKRQVGIKPGAPGSGALGAFFFVLDQVDVVFGAWCVLAWRVSPRPEVVLASLAFVFVSHQLLTLAGYALGMRTTWR